MHQAGVERVHNVQNEVVRVSNQFSIEDVSVENSPAIYGWVIRSAFVSKSRQGRKKFLAANISFVPAGLAWVFGRITQS